MATVSETGRSGEFERLLAVLSDQLLTKDGTTVTTANRLKQARLKMERAQLRYMKEEMMHQLLQRLSATYPVLSRRLGMASALQCLKLTEEEEEGGASTVLGLEERHLYQLAGDTSEWKKEKERVLVDIGEELKREQVLLGDNVTPEGMKGKMESVAAMKADQIQLDKKLQNMREKLFILLHECCEELLSMLSEHHKSVSENRQLTADYLLNKTQAMQYKLKTVKLQIMVATYTKDKIAALSRIRSLLESARSQLEQQVAECRQALGHYHALSPEFVSMAQQYHKIRADCDEKRWALTELAKTAPPT